MNEFEEKYKMFGLNDEMIKSFRNYSVSIDENANKIESIVITTVVIEKAGSPSIVLETLDAKLV